MGNTPFTYGKVATLNDFTNRKEEIALLKRNFGAAINTILISPRRWGKTSLVKRATAEVVQEQKSIKVCYLDIFNLRNESEFYLALASAVLKATASKWEDMTKNALTFLSHLIPQISFSADKQTELSFGVSFDEIRKKPDDILDLAENIAHKKKINLVICIDEFQSISSYKEANAFQQKLRSHWQNHRSVSYCLYGSKRDMLTELFSNPSMPFYKFGDLLLLEKIKTKDWIPFIQKRFSNTGKQITKKRAKQIAILADNHPYYVQQLAQQSWFRTAKNCDEEIVQQAFEAIVDQLSLLFAKNTENLSSSEINMLKAILAGEEQLTSKVVLEKYHLNSSANAVRIKKKLIANELIDERAGEIVFLDPMYKYWLEQQF